MEEDEIDYDRIDDAVLALMYLTWHNFERFTGTVRAWKSFDWDALNRLHEKEMIFDPVNKAKSVLLTKEGMERSKALFEKLFSKA
jgi:hypothetical protein